MLRTPIIPKGDRAGPPLKAALKCRVGYMSKEVAEDCVTFFWRHPVNSCCERRVDVKTFPATDGMSANDWVMCSWIVRFIYYILIRIKAAIDVLAIVGSGEAMHIGHHSGRQRLVGRIHVGKEGVAAAGGRFLDIENATKWWLFLAGNIGMPGFAIGPDRIFVGCNDHDFGIIAQPGRGRMGVQLAKETAKGNLLLWREGLVPKEDNEVFREGAVELLQDRIGQITGEIDAVNFGTDDWGNLPHLHMAVAFRIDLPLHRGVAGFLIALLHSSWDP